MLIQKGLGHSTICDKISSVQMVFMCLQLLLRSPKLDNKGQIHLKGNDNSTRCSVKLLETPHVEQLAHRLIGSYRLEFQISLCFK